MDRRERQREGHSSRVRCGCESHQPTRKGTAHGRGIHQTGPGRNDRIQRTSAWNRCCSHGQADGRGATASRHEGSNRSHQTGPNGAFVGSPSSHRCTSRRRGRDLDTEGSARKALSLCTPSQAGTTLQGLPRLAMNTSITCPRSASVRRTDETRSARSAVTTRRRCTFPALMLRPLPGNSWHADSPSRHLAAAPRSEPRRRWLSRSQDIVQPAPDGRRSSTG